MKKSLLLFFIFILFSCSSANLFVSENEVAKSDDISVPEEDKGTPPEFTEVKSPYNLSATLNLNHKIILNWTHVSGIVSYGIYRAENLSSSFYMLADVKTVLDENGEAILNQTFEDNGSYLSSKPGVNYYYKIVSIDNDGIMSKSSEVVKGKYYDPSIISAPIYKINGIKNGFQIDWDQIPNAIKYHVYYIVNPTETVTATTFESNENVKNISVSVNSCIIESLQADDEVWFCLYSENIDSKRSIPSEILKGDVPSNLPNVTNLVATQGTHADKIVLTWPAVSGAVSYDILKSQPFTIGENTDDKDFEVVATVNSNGWTDLSQLQEKYYFYKVIAIYANNKRTLASDEVFGYITIGAPVLTLLGGNKIFLDTNERYNEANYQFTAIDNNGDDVTENVIVTVEDNKETDLKNGVKGSYRIIYTVEDNSGRKIDLNGKPYFSTAVRQVTVGDAPVFTNAKIGVVNGSYFEKGKNVNLILTGVAADESDNRNVVWTFNDTETVTAPLNTAVTYNVKNYAANTVSAKFATSYNPTMYETSKTYSSIVYDFSDGWNECTFSGLVFIRSAVNSWGTYHEFSDISSAYSYGYSAGEGEVETLVDRSEDGHNGVGSLKICDTTVDTSNWAGVGDKMHVTAKVATPKINLAAGKYKIQSWVYHKGTHANPFKVSSANQNSARIANMGMRVKVSNVANSPVVERNDVANQWIPLELEIILESDVTNFSIEVFKGQITDSFTNSYESAKKTNAQEVRFDDITIFPFYN